MNDIPLSNKEVKKMTQNNEKSVGNITVNVVGVQEANQLVERLCEKIKEANEIIAFCTEKLTKADREVEKLLQERRQSE